MENYLIIAAKLKYNSNMKNVQIENLKILNRQNTSQH